jgi:predicted RNase H-like nuclease
MADCWAGVDGCRGGWVVARIDGRSLAEVRVVATFAEAALTTNAARLTLVDIPIGLPSAERRRDRLCDRIARENLGPRASSVFPVPCREAVWAADYTSACEHNQSILGWRLSKQSWGICPKIREVDALLRLVPRLQKRIRETHPELCFRLLNGGRALDHPKRSRAGLEARRALLVNRIPNLEASLRRIRGARSDDVLDAAAAAVVARLASEGRVATAPLAPETDACGLVMEIVGL